VITSLIFTAIFSITAIQETGTLKDNMIALELFLKDQDDHSKYCPEIKWTQPDIEVYKQKLVTQLPKECKK
jgi:hypothetical protein